MFNPFVIRVLRQLRSPSFRDVFVGVTARLCGASLAGSALLYYRDGDKAQAAIWSLWVVGVMLFAAAVTESWEISNGLLRRYLCHRVSRRDFGCAHALAEAAWR
jgi:hypothetical protein